MVRKMLAEMQPSRKIVRVDRAKLSIARNCSNLTIFYLPDEPFRTQIFQKSLIKGKFLN